MLRCASVWRPSSHLCRTAAQPACFRTRRAAFALTRGYATSPEAPVTKVEKIILDNIKATGPVPFASYMQMCLSHPTDGYYMNPANPVFGTQGDFITSPEISQVFGELLAIWLLSQYLSDSAAAACQLPVRLVELGPGRGTLMEDLLRVLHRKGYSTVKEIHLVETSASMRTIQKAKLHATAERIGCALFWHDAIEDIPPDAETYTMLVAHEFFDALPFHLLERTDKGWQEVLVASNPQPDPTLPSLITKATLAEADVHAQTAAPFPTPLSSSLNLAPSPPRTPSPLDTPTPLHSHPQPQLQLQAQSQSQSRFRHVLAPTPTPMSTLLGLSSPRFAALPVGARVEVSRVAGAIARKVGELVGPAGAPHAGAALIVDYGDEQAFGDSFRGFKDHTIVDVFHRPGECDLTANVDFAYLKEALFDVALPLGTLPQRVFLERMGLHARTDALMRAAPTPERRDAIEQATQRIADPAGMGREYRVLGVLGGRPERHERDGADTDGKKELPWPFTELDAEDEKAVA